MRKLTGSMFVALAAVLAAGMLVACGGSSGTAGGSDVPKSDAPTDLPKFEGTTDAQGDTATTDVATPDGEEPDAVEPDEGVADPGKDEGKPDTAQPETTQPDPGPVVECEDAADCEGKLEGVGPCEVATCEQTTHTCVARAKQNGAACDDENHCTQDDYCSNGVCKGKPVTCDDDNVCTNDDCDPDSGCTHANNKVACDDGSACTKDDQCKDGACVPGENSCQCQEDKDCIPMDDGDLCNGVMKCVANACSVDPNTVVPCDTSADNQCKVTACVPATGACEAIVAADGKPCDDADACTSGEACAAGECAGGSAVACDDQNPCTTDTCDEAAGCVFAPNTEACDDGDDCTEGDACANGVCQPGKLTCPTTCVPAMSLFCDVSHKHDNGGEGSTNVAAAYACNEGAAYTGPEYTYSFVAPWDGTFTVTLMDEAADTDVLVLEAGDGCDPAKCIAWGTDGVTFTAQSYKTYYLVVDGFEGATGGYSIHVACVPATELYCDDGIDNDKDGDTDCDDSDCLGTATCPLPGCVPGWTLACGEKDAWTTYWFGATDQVDGYSCNANLYTGPEYAYSFSTPTKQKVLVKLTNESGTTDLLVLKGDCSSSTCIDHGAVQSTFVAEPNEDYYFVVDGRDGAEGKYTITVTCTALTEEACGDGKDNEGDGLTDCDDPDCLGTAECPTCEWGYVLACGDTDSWGTGREGATDVVDAYSCSDAMSHEGPEYTYYFYSEFDQDVTITLSDETADLDIQVLEMDDTQVCNAAKCLDWGVDSLTFAAKAGARYYIVIDAWTGGLDPVFSGDYTIDVNCM